MSKEVKNVEEVLNVNALSLQILQGTADEEQLGTVLKTISVALGANLLNGQSKACKLLDSATKNMELIMGKFEELLHSEAEVFTDAEVCWSWMSRMHSMQMNVLEFQRKVAQGKPLFAVDTLSADEKMVVKLLHSFTSTEKKKKFLELVRVTLEENEKEQGFDDLEE